MGLTIATIFLTRSYCHTYSGYLRVDFVFRQNGAPAHRARDTVAFLQSERYSTSFLQQCGRQIHRILTQSTIYSIRSVLREKVYPSRIAHVDELKTRLIDEWAHFD